MKKTLVALTILMVLVLQGCATSRSVIDIHAPAEHVNTQVNDPSRPSLYIRQVIDKRQFQDAPNSADIPSLGFEGASAATEDIKARAVGRKRNGYGKALGDILLPEGTTVTDLVQAAAAEGFEKAGWQVVNNANSSQDVTTVDIEVTRFWTWFQPGFWSLALNTDIETEFGISDQHHISPIHVHNRDKMQVALDSDWKKSTELALEQYRDAIASQAKPWPQGSRP
ncbi:MAG: hypothetical protein ACTH3D_04345 [Halomonas sp.]|uniref:hypothetical protein n=1 Tax=Halomonas sp. TaxID=1486246 RepID=UPI003F92D374